MQLARADKTTQYIIHNRTHVGRLRETSDFAF